MAYKDIEMWRQILENEESAKRDYELACEKNAEAAAELDEKEFWECDEKEIDPKTLGMVDENEADDYDVEKTLRAAKIPGVADVVVSAGKILVKGDGATDMASLAGEIQNALQDADWMNASVVYNDGLESMINGEPYTEYSFELDPYASDDYDDYDEYDEDIDFSQYQLDEADMREPLTAASAALDRPASTADLAAQDAVRLMAEAFTKAIGGRTQGDDPMKFLDEAAIEDMLDDEQLKALDGLEKNDDLPLTDDDWKTVDGLKTFAEKVKFIQDKCEGIELSPSAQEELDATIELLGHEAQSDARDADSAAALEAAKKFYEKWLTDPDFREMNSKEGKPQVIGVRNGQKITKSYPVTDPNSTAARQFKSYFDRMTDLDKEAFDTWAHQAQKRFVAKMIAPREFDRGGGMKGGLHNGENQISKGQDLHSVGGDEDHENPLAQHGFDVIKGQNQMAAIDDDPAAGEDFYMDVDQDKTSQLTHAGIYQDILDKADQMAREAGVSQKELAKRFSDGFKKRRILNTVVRAGRENKALTDYQLEYIFQALDPEDQDALKAELVSSLPWPNPDGTPGDRRKQQSFIDYLFRAGKERQVTQNDLLKQFGIAGDQGGKTGAGTQNADTIIYVIICALANFYNVMRDESKELWDHKGRQQQNADLKNRNLEPRRYAKHLACAILQDLFDELTEPGQTPPEIPQLPIENCRFADENGVPLNSRQLKLNMPAKDWNEVQKKLGALLSLINLKGEMNGGEAKAEADGVFQAIRQKINQWNGSEGAKGEREARKLKTYLTDKQNGEFQKLLEKVRQDPELDSMTDAEMRQLIVFERMRLGYTQAQAETWFQNEMSRKRDEFGKRSYGEIENGLKIFCQREAKKFLDGGSGNMTRDNIRVQAARQAEEPETELAENDFDDMLQEALGAK